MFRKKKDDEKLEALSNALDEIEAKTNRPIRHYILIALCGAYVLNLTGGMDLVPDFIPLAGNLDESTSMVLIWRSLNKLGLLDRFNNTTAEAA